MLKIKYITIFLVVIVIFSSCEKKDDTGKGIISFGTNTHMYHCELITKVYIDNKEIGIIPGFCDTIIDCQSGNTLNIEVQAGKHNYKIEINGKIGCTFYYENFGEFTIENGECKMIFFDITKKDV